ncbi:MAG: hypothetical protein NTX50_25270, partial [Candidatus Sumerlaeota bacterium]|nr:hypothetical protein [Candidatus Sumerlaeota bacterium]
RVDDIDLANNAVVVDEQPCAMLLVKRGFQEVDIPPSVLSLDVAIYEVDAQNDLAIGFDYESWKNGPGRALFEAIFWDFSGSQREQYFPGAVPMDGERWGRYYSHDVTLTTAYIDFLQSRGKAKLRTKATLVAKSGTAARVSAVDDVVAFNVKTTSRQSQHVQAGRTLPLADVYNYYHRTNAIHPSLGSLLEKQYGTPSLMTSAQVVAFLAGFMTNTAKLDSATVAKAQAELTAKAAAGPLTQEQINATLVATQSSIATYADRSIKYENVDEVGVAVSVLPVVGLESAELALAIDVTEVTGLTPSGAPIIDHRAFNSQFEVKDGQPIVMSGIKKSAKVMNKNGIPYLSDIPLLGYAFGRKVDTKRQADVVVVLTPKFRTHSMKDTEPAEEVKVAGQLAKGEYKIEIPCTSFGFDQWLLDKEARLKF